MFHHLTSYQLQQLDKLTKKEVLTLAETKQLKHINKILQLTDEEYTTYQREHKRIITEFYQRCLNDATPTGVPKKDFLRNRIEFYMTRNYITLDSDIQTDVLQFVFENLLKTDCVSVVDKYNDNPKSLLYLGYRIALQKGFSIAPKTPDYPNHSLAKSITFSSAFKPDALQVSTNEIDDADDNEDGFVERRFIIYDDTDVEENFTKRYGISIEEIIERLLPEQRELFYKLLDTKKRGYPTKEHQMQKEALFARIRDIVTKRELSEEEKIYSVLTLQQRKEYDIIFNDELTVNEKIKLLKLNNESTFYYRRNKLINHIKENLR